MFSVLHILKDFIIEEGWMMGQISTGRFNLFIYNGSTWTMGKHLRLPMERLMVVRRTIMRGQGLTGYCIGLSGLSLTHYGPVWGFLSRN